MTCQKIRPDWLKIKLNNSAEYQEVKQLVHDHKLHTVCEEARCPNIYECWAKRTATFMILGDICTRACRFCAVKTGCPTTVDADEPRRLAETVQKMGLHYAVITSVARDDLEDGGASHFAAVIREVRRLNPLTNVEVLIPDFMGCEEALRIVMDAKPDVLNHNIETTRALSDRVRSKAKYDRSLILLSKAKQMQPQIPTKSSIMVGLGESFEEIVETMRDLIDHQVSIATIGQYLSPTDKHIKLERYYTPEEFEELKRIGLELGFAHVESGPLVRSSYRAKEQMEAALCSSKASSQHYVPAQV